MNHNNFFISTDQQKLDFDVIYQFISNSYWAKDIPCSLMQKAIENALCFGVYTGQNEQVGFARVITDSATFAYLADVFIVPTYQGMGLSKYLMNTIITHEQLQGLRRFMLATSDAHGLYKQFGFTELNEPNLFLQISRVNPYQT
ncbi:GNAT family N-acetyltransferase [Pseudoalteromonas sp. MMG010]|uniref:GNAT family N-acetyltransferase n=1 Tax=Pseudoalteromonas sp. MMG010 TaxID=2822685 RepID=UPI001B3A50F2|nr:GNAT family N-acetyltransferase [Pseudoalteromonas sp. MMG010]MBQ4833179.1 GNAT family N-acetyltransferase [Pseudoalteromonas sp. MMG010]